jgi:microcystin-dependent protein
MFTLSPFMNLPIATVGSEPGPTYAFDVNNSFTLVDSHNHTPGQGVPVTPAGLNINTNLSFQSNQAIALGATVYTALSAATSTLQAISVAPGSESPTPIQDLWYTDSAGNKIQITAGGTLAAAAAAIPGESYSAGTFYWKQGAGSTTPANFDIGSITLRPNVALTTFGVILGPPSSIASQYNVNLPILPTSTSFLAIDTSGNMSATISTTNGLTASNISPSAGLNPAGAVIMHAGAAAPTGYVLCNGASYNTTTQAALFAAIGYVFGGSGVNFNVPNIQGIFVRGVGSQIVGGKTYAGALGNLENDQFAAHTHSVYGGNSGGTASALANGVSDGVAGSVNPGGQGYYLTAPASGQNFLQNSGAGTETQPANIALNYIIKT